MTNLDLGRKEVRKKMKSSRVKNYGHYIKSDKIFQNGYGSSFSSDSDVSPNSFSDEHKPDMSWVLHQDDRDLCITQV